MDFSYNIFIKPYNKKFNKSYIGLKCLDFEGQSELLLYIC